MQPDEFESLLRAQVDEAKSEYERVKRALAAYLGLRNSGSKRRSIPGYQHKTPSIAITVRKIVHNFEAGHIFTAEDVFNQMISDGFDTAYSKARPSISTTLSRMVDEERIKKINLRSFKKLKMEE